VWLTNWKYVVNSKVIIGQCILMIDVEYFVWYRKVIVLQCSMSLVFSVGSVRPAVDYG